MEPVLSGGVASRLLPSPALSRPLKRPAFGLTAPRSGRREPLDARAAARSLAALSRPGSSVRNGLACAGAWVPGAISAVRTVGTTVPTAGRVFARVELATDLEGAGAARAAPGARASAAMASVRRHVRPVWRARWGVICSGPRSNREAPFFAAARTLSRAEGRFRCVATQDRRRTSRLGLPLALTPQARHDLATVNVVFLSPHFPPNWWHFCRGLRQAGATVLGLGDAPYEWLSPELRETLTEYFKVDDMHNYDELLRAVGHFTHRHGKIDRLDSLNEYWLETEARLRTDFNIPGIGQRAIARMKRKSLMKGRFARTGLRVPRGRVCRSTRATRAFVNEVGYPVVAKPDAGVGAARTYKIENEADLDRYLRDKLAVDY